MPKKFHGENTKSADARARKSAQKVAERERIEKEAADAYWADDDKNASRKQQRKEERETKRHEQLQKKKELQELHDKEMAALPGKSSGNSAARTDSATANKVTRAEIEAYRQRMAAEAEIRAKAASGEAAAAAAVVTELPLEENVNRMVIEGDEARTVDEALKVLGSGGDEDRHPERRARAAWLAYEEANLPRAKQENPNLRLSQLKQLLKKEWQKAPENPFNQRP